MPCLAYSIDPFTSLSGHQRPCHAGFSLVLADLLDIVMAVEEQPGSNSFRAARELGDLLASIEVRADWSVVETTAQSLADGLRNRDGPSE